MTRALDVLFVSFLAATLSTTLAAQGARGPVPKPTRFEPQPGTEDATNLVVKFVEGSRVRLRGGAFVAAGRDLRAVHAALAGATAVTRLFERDEAVLDAERDALVRRLATAGIDVEPPADLNLYFRVRLPTVAAGVTAWQALVADPAVETAFPDTPPGYEADPTDILPVTPSFTAQQTYFGAHPTGIDIVRARVLPGGRGEGVQIVDIETGLIVDHEDIPAATLANVIGPMNQQTDHGQAVAGELVAERNAYGVTGGVWRAGYKFHSHLSQFWANSVNVAAANSQPGDVIVLEVQLPCPVTGTSVCPMEGRQDVFDAVRNATLAGIHVIAAAGNGNQNLDNPVFGGRFDRAVRDSGAILCGATDAGQLTRASFSNHGSIVDANGWGQQVTTTGYGLLFSGGGDPRQRYTSTFSGTSSATPIVTSAAVATLGAAKHQLGQVLTPAQLRQKLQTHGTAVATIGRRPDVGALMASLGLPNGLELVAEVDLGGTIVLNVAAASTEFRVVMGDYGGSVSVQPFGRLLLDPATLVLADVGIGAGSYSTSVPVVQALRGTELHWQALRVDANTGAWRLTNSVVTHFAQ